MNKKKIIYIGLFVIVLLLPSVFSAEGDYVSTYSFALDWTPEVRGTTIDYDNQRLFVVGSSVLDVYMYDVSPLPISYYHDWTLENVGITLPWGIAYDGSYFFVVNTGNDTIYEFSDSGTYRGWWALDNGNSDPRGIATDGINFFVLDNYDLGVWKYDMSGVYQDFNSLTAGNDDPQGITTDGNYIWVVDYDGWVYKYNMNMVYQSKWGLTGNNVHPRGIAQNGTYFWVTDSDDDYVYAYEFKDITNPSVTINQPLNQTYNTKTINFNVTATDKATEGMSDCEYTLNNGLNNFTMSNLSTSPTQWIATNSTMSEGSHTVIYYCTDTSGRINNSETVDFYVRYPVNYTANISQSISFTKRETIQLQEPDTENLGDAKVTEGVPDKNEGDYVQMHLNTQAGWDDDIYIKFNISEIPSGATISDAHIYFYHYKTIATEGSANLYHVYSNVSWNEETITWNNQPCGIDFTDSSNCSLIGLTSFASPPAWRTWDVTSQVIYSINKGWNNVSFGVSDVGNSYAYVISKEDATNTTLRPYLNITYEYEVGGNIAVERITTFSRVIFQVIKFMRAKKTYDFSGVFSSTAFNKTIANKPPLSLAPTGETELSYTEIASSDDTYVRSTNLTDYPYQRFNMSITDSNIHYVDVHWEGHTSPTGNASLFVWNYTSSVWILLTSGTGTTDFNLTARITDLTNLRQSGNINFLVQDG